MRTINQKLNAGCAGVSPDAQKSNKPTETKYMTSKLNRMTRGLAAAGLLISCAFAQEARPWRTVLEPLGAPAGAGTAGLAQICVETDRLGRLTVFGLRAGGSGVAFRQQIAANGGWPAWQNMPRTGCSFPVHRRGEQ